jgi:hypothetical protein
VVGTRNDSGYHFEFEPRQTGRGARVMIDRYHPTIYKLPDGETTAEVMLDLMARDGAVVRYLDAAEEFRALAGDVLIIHGLPGEEVPLEGEDTYVRSPLSADDVDAVARFVYEGGGLFLTLSHFPNGSGGKPLLDAFSVSFRDGYLYHPAAPSVLNPEDRCSHFFGLSVESGTLNAKHPILAAGLPVRRVDFLCGAAVVRRPEDVIIAFPPGSSNYDQDGRLLETSDSYAGLIGFPFGRGRVVVATDQGLFRNLVLETDDGREFPVTITSPTNDNAALFLNLMRWLSPAAEG